MTTSATADTALKPEEVSYKPPIFWVPTSYFAMGAVYTMVTTSANILFKNVGLPNDQAALYSSLTGFAFSFKPLWAPLSSSTRRRSSLSC